MGGCRLITRAEWEEVLVGFCCEENAETFTRSDNVQTKPGNFDMTYERQAMVSLLRSPGMVFYNGGNDKCALLRTVANQIEADGKRIAELEAALSKIGQIGERSNNDYTVCPDCIDMETTARAALEGKR